MSDDVANPATWFDKQLHAIAGIQRGDTAPATEYLRFVEQHRGREAAHEARRSLRRLADSRAFADAAAIINKRQEKLCPPLIPPSEPSSSRPKSRKRTRTA